MDSEFLRWILGLLIANLVVTAKVWQQCTDHCERIKRLERRLFNGDARR